jgi:hypothetical protein
MDDPCIVEQDADGSESSFGVLYGSPAIIVPTDVGTDEARLSI